jgi:O-antigen/teichoic acid export membrane protein
METSNIPGGTLRITLANASQYIIMALFYVIVTKTNALTQTDIGTLSILSFIASVFSLLTLLALPTALTKFTSEKLGKNQKGEATAIQKTVTKTVVTLSIAGLAAAALSSRLISQYLLNNPEYMFLVILMLTHAFLTNMLGLCRSTLQALYLFGKMAAITVTFIVSSRIVAIALALLHMGVTGVIIGYIIGSTIAITVAINFLRGKLPKTTENMPLKPLLYFSFPLFLTSITGLVLGWADIAIITSLTGDYSLTGVYYVVISSVATLSILYLPMMTTIFPALSAHHGLAKPESISDIVRTTSRYIIYIIFPSCIGLAIIAPTALTFFYGPGYAEGATPLTILSITTIIIALHSLFSTTLTATGKTGQILKINIAAALTTVLTLVALVPLLETTGAALARLTTQIIALTLAVYALSKEIKIHLDKEALWKSALATTATVPVLLALELVISAKLTTTQTLITEILTAAAIYAIALYILKALKNQDFELLKQAFPKPLTKYLNFLQRIIVR